MLIGIQNEILKLHSLKLLDMLLSDKTTKANILWATDAYADLGDAYGRDKEITPPLITAENSGVIKNRARKALEQQTERTRRHAEVFTPLWICRKMNDHADETWFERPGAFFDADGKPTERVIFPKSRRKRPEWQRYVDSRRLEITCGEAPYLVSRYDVSTGEYIEIEDRIGILDRKLRVINENAADEKEWLKWAMRAFRTTYGYEFQGDNLLIARVNLLMTFEEYLQERWNRKPTPKEYQTVANIIAWNIWQMDGLTGTIPYCKAEEEFRQISLFDLFAMDDVAEPHEQKGTQPRCRIYDWLGDRSLNYQDVNTGGRNMKFDFVIGNPPYQEDTESDSTRMPPIYNLFMDSVYELADRVELITPARFLFDAGYTPKAWNQKMLNDAHFKVLHYEAISGKIFPNTDIKGGIAISYRDATQNFGTIGTFAVFPELNSILSKVRANSTAFLNSICYPALSYGLTPKMLSDFPDSIGRLRTSAFEKLSEIFYEEKPQDDHEYIRLLGLLNGKRVYRYVRRDYIKTQENFEAYKIILPASNGSGAIGEVLSTPLIGQPLIGHTQTFISIGNFKTNEEAEACLKFVKSKFARTMLGVLKITQHNPPEKWKYVPLQDFTPSSDIDWSQSVADIDRQLYKKYNLSPEEIDFIETHVKEME